MLKKSVKHQQRLVTVLGILGAALLFYCLDFFFRISQSIVIEPLTMQYHISALGIGGFASAFYLGYALMQLPAGMLLDRFSFQYLFAGSIFICSAGFVAFVWSHDYWLGYILRLLIGAASALSFIGVLYIARCFIARTYFSLIAGIAIAIGTFAASWVQMINAFLIESMDWHFIFSGVAGIALLLGLVMLLPLFRLPNPHKKPSLSNIQPVITLLKQPTFLMNALIGSLFYLPTTLFASLWGVPFLQQVYHYSETKASFGIMLLFLGWAIGSPIIGYLSKNRHTAWRIMILGAGSGLLISILLIYSTQFIDYGLLLIFLFGLASSTQTAVWAIFEDQCPTHLSGVGLSLTNMIIMLGGTVFHVIVGLLLSYGVFSYEAGFNYHLGLSIIPLSFALVAVLAYLIGVAARKTVTQTKDFNLTT